MLGDPRRMEKTEEAAQEVKPSRFKFVKLEERIAPRHDKYGGNHGNNCHYNPHGKLVGCGND